MTPSDIRQHRGPELRKLNTFAREFSEPALLLLDKPIQQSHLFVSRPPGGETGDGLGEMKLADVIRLSCKSFEELTKGGCHLVIAEQARLLESEVRIAVRKVVREELRNGGLLLLPKPVTENSQN